ncbi:MAG: MFS transporter [Actinobacteria bacterium]|nr:MFS transporter [Actinomycetota bacterium]
MAVKEDGNWRSFRHRNYRILFPANAASNIGTWAQRVAQDWLVLQLTDNSGIYLGLVTAIQFAPVLLFSLQGGALADRVNKRKLLIFTNLIGALSSLGLGLLVVAGHVQVWHVFFFALTLGISSAIDAPIRQSFTSEIVGHSDIANAVSLNSANFNAGRLVGPALSGFLIARFDTGPSFLINAFTYLFVILALLRMRESDFFIQEKKVTQGTVREGLNYALARPDLYVVMLVVFFVATFGLNMQIFNALMATKEFGKGPASYGLLGTYVAIGSLTGALLSARLERFRTTLFVIKGGVVFSLAIALLSIAPTYTWYSFWLPICGLSALTMLISANSLIQVNSDPAIRGRVSGIYLLIFMGGTPFGSPLIGWLVEVIGVRETIALCGLISLGACLTVWAVFHNKVNLPHDISVEGVLPAAYDDQR